MASGTKPDHFSGLTESAAFLGDDRVPALAPEGASKVAHEPGEEYEEMTHRTSPLRTVSLENFSDDADHRGVGKTCTQAHAAMALAVFLGNKQGEREL